jgi:hypothetical protein
MSQTHWLLFWLVGLIALGIWGGLSFWSRETRLQRRRRKSHSRIISKADRPTVRFSVRLPGSKKKK